MRGQGTWSFSRWWQAYIWQAFSLNAHCSWRLYDLHMSVVCSVQLQSNGSNIFSVKWHSSLCWQHVGLYENTGALEQRRRVPANVDGVKTQITRWSTPALTSCKRTSSVTFRSLLTVFSLSRILSIFRCVRKGAKSQHETTRLPLNKYSWNFVWRRMGYQNLLRKFKWPWLRFLQMLPKFLSLLRLPWLPKLNKCSYGHCYYDD
jgi:hypothetical protein